MVTSRKPDINLESELQLDLPFLHPAIVLNHPDGALLVFDSLVGHTPLIGIDFEVLLD